MKMQDKAKLCYMSQHFRDDSGRVKAVPRAATGYGWHLKKETVHFLPIPNQTIKWKLLESADKIYDLHTRE